MQKFKFLVIIASTLLFTGCLQVKAPPTSTATHIDNNLEQLESSLDNFDLHQLQELLADELMLDWDNISKSDLEKIIGFFGDFDEIEAAKLTEQSRTIVDDTIIIDAELYLELIKNQELFSDIKNINIIMENLGTKWTGDRWLITSIMNYTQGYQYQNPATDPNELLDRFVQALEEKTFSDLRDLLSYTLVAINGDAVNYYRNNQQFISLLASDMQDIEVRDIELVKRHLAISSEGINVQAELQANLTYNGANDQYSQELSFIITEIPEGLVISQLFYRSKFFGLF